MATIQRPNRPTPEPVSTLMTFLWILLVLDILATLSAYWIFPEIKWLLWSLSAVAIAITGYLAYLNQKALRTRSVAHGVNSLVTILLVISIVAVLNFLVSRYPQKLDLTKNKVNSLSDQTVKIVKGLQQEVTASLFVGGVARDKYRPLLENYKALNPKFKLEFVDPSKEMVRTQAARINEPNTLELAFRERKQLIQDPTEEKLTNALIKLTKEKTSTLCAVTGHGEKAFSSNEPMGYGQIRQQLLNQSYTVKDINLLQEKSVPADCDSVAMIGPNKPLLADEEKAIGDYLAKGGRMVVALDLDVRTRVEPTPQLVSLLRQWHVNFLPALAVDPAVHVRDLGPTGIVISDFSRDHAITKDFASGQIAVASGLITTIFPMSRPIEIVPGAPAGMNATWLARTSRAAWGITDLAKLSKGGPIQQEAADKKGPLDVAVAVDGKQKDSAAPRNTRIVAFGNSLFATNQFQSLGLGSDLFLNAVSWIMEDESLISIRAKEESQSRVNISQRQASVIGLTTMIMLPLLIAISGIVVWIYRRRL